jgi:outer membrane protein OmpA-like peptidoglycan-associated protein
MNQKNRIARNVHAAAACVAFAAIFATGCGHDAKPAVAANTDIVPMDAPVPVAVSQPLQGSVQISEGVRQKCDLPDTPSDAPQFDFDEAALRPRGEGILEQLARCLQSGNMMGQTISVVGHADPRGSEEYNYSLGEQRARAAADYLQQRGVPSSQIAVESRGEEDASGHDEQSWQLDRNVQIAEKSP